MNSAICPRLSIHMGLIFLSHGWGKSGTQNEEQVCLPASHAVMGMVGTSCCLDCYFRHCSGNRNGVVPGRQTQQKEAFPGMRPWGSCLDQVPLLREKENLFLLWPGHPGRPGGPCVSKAACTRANGPMELGFFWCRCRIKKKTHSGGNFTMAITPNIFHH